MDAATEIGAGIDWHAVTFQAIADKTGLSKGGIMHHFRNKEELLEELMKQSLQDLTEWINQDLLSSGSDNASIAFLKFTIDKSQDEKYMKTMKVILQATVSGQYHDMWKEWFQENISSRTKGASSVTDLIIQLVADGLWYSETAGLARISDADKQKILIKLREI